MEDYSATGGRSDDAVAPSIKRDAAGLMPAIVQADGTGEVLMLAWMDDEALRRTLDTGRATYWSRSRRSTGSRARPPGTTSTSRSVALDCDGDALLVRVDQVGAGLPHRRAHLLLRRLAVVERHAT